MPSPDGTLEPAVRRLLVEVARRSIAHGLEWGEPLEPEPGSHPSELEEPRACFVTLRHGGELRGCIGALEPVLTLVQAVARHAYGAAFADPRFPPLGHRELAGLEVHISVLGPLEPLAVGSRGELIAALRPKRDGLVLRQGERRATFLPAVWEALPDPPDFVSELERKAGLPADAWARGVECLRYRAEEWSG